MSDTVGHPPLTSASSTNKIDQFDPRWPFCDTCHKALYITFGGFETQGKFLCNECAGVTHYWRICQ